MDSYLSTAHRVPAEAVATEVSRETIANRSGGGKSLAQAFVALSLFMVVYCARPEDWIPGLTYVPLAKIAGILALLAFAMSLGQIRRRLPAEVTLLLLLTVQLFATVPFSPVWKGGAFVTTLDFAKVALIVLVMVMAVNTAKRLRTLLFIQAASVAAISVVAVWKGRTIGSRLGGILNGNYSNPNDLALSIIISLPLCLALMFLSKRTLSKIAWVLAMVVMSYAVLLTGSRGGFLAFMIVVGVCLWEFAIKGRRFYLLGLTAVAVLILAIASSATLGKRLIGTFDSSDDAESAYGSAQARKDLLVRSMEVMFRNPLFGVGPGNFQVMSGSWHVTHNSYTQMGSEGGIPALILYLMILWRGFRNVKATKRLARGQKDMALIVGALHACLAGFVVGSFFASYAYQFFPYFLVSYTTVILWIAQDSIARSKEALMAPHEAYASAQPEFRHALGGNIAIPRA
jgi:putative inorganic carbon (hco3(-)) transporter